MSKDDDDLMSMKSVLRFFGGDKPIHASTLYRGMDRGRFPRPVKPSPNVARWLRSECEAAKRRAIEERDRG
jgi:predicted DNA-binding transcriptional regulator AlpA